MKFPNCFSLLKYFLFSFKLSLFLFDRVVGSQVAPESEDGTQIISNVDSGNRNSNNVTSSLSKTGFLETVDPYSATNLDVGK